MQFIDLLVYFLIYRMQIYQIILKPNQKYVFSIFQRFFIAQSTHKI